MADFTVGKRDEVAAGMVTVVPGVMVRRLWVC